MMRELAISSRRARATVVLWSVGEPPGVVVRWGDDMLAMRPVTRGRSSNFPSSSGCKIFAVLGLRNVGPSRAVVS